MAARDAAAGSPYASLIAKVEAARWSPVHDIEWRRPPRVPRWIGRERYARILAHLRFGERVTAHVCRRLAAEEDDVYAARFLRLQAEDEERHAEAYGLYLARLGLPEPPLEPAFQAFSARALAWRGGPEALVVAFHVAVESEALAILRSIVDWLPCPIIVSLSRRIARDESHHVAFGRLYLVRRLARLPAGEALAIRDWAFALWQDGASASVAALIGGTGGPLGAFCRRAADNLAKRERRLRARFSDVGLPEDPGAFLS